MANFEEHYCESCRGRTSWLVKDLGVRCTGCGTTLHAPGPFRWEEHYCDRCRGRMVWVECGNGLVVCMGCGQGG